MEANPRKEACRSASPSPASAHGAWRHVVIELDAVNARYEMAFNYAASLHSTDGYCHDSHSARVRLTDNATITPATREGATVGLFAVVFTVPGSHGKPFIWRKQRLPDGLKQAVQQPAIEVDQQGLP